MVAGRPPDRVLRGVLRRILVDARSGRCGRGYPTHADLVSGLAWSPDERLLTHNAVDDRHPAWSPDGTQLLEARSDRAGHAVAIVVLAVDGSGERLVRREAPGTTLL